MTFANPLKNIEYIIKFVVLCIHPWIVLWTRVSLSSDVVKEEVCKVGFAVLS